MGRESNLNKDKNKTEYRLSFDTKVRDNGYKYKLHYDGSYSKENLMGWTLALEGYNEDNIDIRTMYGNEKTNVDKIGIKQNGCIHLTLASEDKYDKAALLRGTTSVNAHSSAEFTLYVEYTDQFDSLKEALRAPPIELHLVRNGVVPTNQDKTEIVSKATLPPEYN